MGKGDGEGGGAVGAGAVGGRQATFAAVIVGTIVLTGAGYALVHSGKLGQLKVDPSRMSWEMLQGLMRAGISSLRDSDILVDTKPSVLGSRVKLPDGQVGTPVATGKQLKRALRVVQPSYEELASRIDMTKIVGSGGTEGTREAARERMRKLRLNRKLVNVVIMDLQKQRRRAGGGEDGGAA